MSSNKKLTIGTSGFVYPAAKGQTPRKAEHLYGQLARDKDFADCEFVASGRGWPVKTKGYSWQDMPKYYQPLDLYISTSIVEGIGYGPLEAMACGVPVVIPENVGIFDELADIPNIYRYTAGDYDSLKSAALLAIDDIKNNRVNQKQLRNSVLGYTQDTWVSDHTNAFEQFLYSIPEIKPKKHWKDNACLFYVAYGKPALDCFKRAVASAKAYLPDIPVVLVSDKPGFGEDIFVYHSDDDIGARSVKTQVYNLAPKEFEYVLYLDADTEFVSSDVTCIFDFLNDGWELIFCTNPENYILAQDMKRPDNEDEINDLVNFLSTGEMLQLNGGVFAFRRNERTERLFRLWHKEYLIYFKRDQAALDRAYYKNPVRLYVLGQEFNTITRYVLADRTAGILHYPLEARRYRGKVQGRLNSSEAWAALHPSQDDFEQWKKDNEQNRN